MPLGEADLLLVLFAPALGKIRAAARGARRLTSRLVGHLEPLTRVDLYLANGRSLDTVSQAQVLDGFPAMKADLEAASRGIYVAELLDGFGLEGSGNPPLYDLACVVLGLLGGPSASDMLLRYFELKLLEFSGFLPELYNCVECGNPPGLGHHVFSPDGGGLLCDECRPSGVHVMPLSAEALEMLRFLLDAQPLHAARLSPTGEQEQQIKALLAATVRYWLDREVRSGDFLDLVDTGG
jgi:DNA repair protein RecO (recombination protein O)